MNRKTWQKLICMSLTLVMALSLLSITAEAKNYYFAGVYKNKAGEILRMNQYSSPEGKIKGNFHIETNGGGFFCEGTLKKIGTNKYRYNAGNFKLTFKVKKKKVIVKQDKKIYMHRLGRYFTYAGTYKLKKRYRS